MVYLCNRVDDEVLSQTAHWLLVLVLLIMWLVEPSRVKRQSSESERSLSDGLLFCFYSNL